MKNLRKNIWWKALALIVLAGILNNVWEILFRETQSFIGSIIINLIYITFWIGIVGLAFNKKILSRNIWKFMFGVASLLFVYSVVILVIAFSNPIKVAPNVPNIQVLYVLSIYIIKLIVLFFVVYAMLQYAYKRDYLWQNNIT